MTSAERSQTSNKATVTHFGAFSYRSDGMLFSGETPLDLPPKETRLLALLLERRGEIVTHGEIEAAVWPRQQISYTSMARLVHSLRRALGEDRSEYIETLPKRGYRLIAPAERPPCKQISQAVLDSVATDSRTYATYLEAKRHANDPHPESQAAAAELMQSALNRDPGYVAAAISLAETRMYQSLRGYLPPTKALRLGQRACRHALSLDRDSVPALCLDAWFRAALGEDPSSALARVEQALEADTDYIPGLVCLSFLLRAVGLLDRSVTAAERAYTLDPYTLTTSHAFAWSLFCNGRAAEALSVELEITARCPHHDVAQANRALFAAFLGDLDEADRACDELLSAKFVAPVMETAVVYTLAQKGDRSGALAGVERLASPNLPRAPRPHLAAICYAAGETERAIAFLREAQRERCPWYLISRVDPRLQGLQGFEP